MDCNVNDFSEVVLLWFAAGLFIGMLAGIRFVNRNVKGKEPCQSQMK